MTSSISEIQTRQSDLVIEVDDVDSALGGDLSTYTRSLRSSIFQGVQENGRAYHRYKDGSYILPQDDLEQERLDLQHEIFLVAFHRKLFLAPVQRSMQEVLDLGTGTGIWAIGFADQHPESNVLGIDLSPIQPHAVPPNCKLRLTILKLGGPSRESLILSMEECS
ncbi:hypothetical protein FOPE_00714 [Fonsecaea pedrosoi]|nr:hypothetical protein FOPE_00714 [Fonsecaea pedrosoi]